MENLRKGLPITEFKPGQILTRLEKSEFKVNSFNENLGIEMTMTKYKDGSYRGEPLKFLGIENNMIYLEHIHGLNQGNIVSLELENGWDIGWGIWIDPKTLEKNFK